MYWLASSEPVPLMDVARQTGCDTSTLCKYFPDLCQAVVMRYRKRFDNEQVQQRLQEVLTSNEEVPSVSELARQMGYGVDTIWAHCTDLCKQISARYRAQQRKQGIYPSSRRVSERLNNRHILRMIEGHEAWHLMLEELGYPTDKLKRYDWLLEANRISSTCNADYQDRF